MAENRSEESKKKRREYSSQYSAEHYERINLTVPIGTKEKFKKMAEWRKKSVSALVVEAMDRYASMRGKKF